jgi:hypothetical protein
MNTHKSNPPSFEFSEEKIIPVYSAVCVGGSFSSSPPNYSLLAFRVQSSENSNEDESNEKCIGIYVSRQNLEEIRNEINDCLDRNAKYSQSQFIKIAKRLKQHNDEISKSQDKFLELMQNVVGDSGTEKNQKSQSNKLLRVNPERVIIRKSSSAESDLEWAASLFFCETSLHGYGNSEEEARFNLDKQFDETIHNLIDTLSEVIITNQGEQNEN